MKSRTTDRTPETIRNLADGYDRLMGRYLPPLAPAFADVGGVRTNMRLLDVGCGPGVLTRGLRHDPDRRGANPKSPSTRYLM
jgi:2-polyprenyl-3-methyl-5-hydroxy-6-metoxy-1,4-benzoquinol methylase